MPKAVRGVSAGNTPRAVDAIQARGETLKETGSVHRVALKVVDIMEDFPYYPEVSLMAK